MSSELARLAARVAALEKQLSRTTRTARMAYSSIEDGAIDVYDRDGSLRGSIGMQDDGSVAFVAHNGPPPPTPTAPTVEPTLSGLTITWPGTWTDAETAPLDLAEVQVHIATTADAEPDTARPVAAFHTTVGGSVTVALDTYDTLWVRLIALNTSGTAGEPSTAISGQARKAVPDDLVNAIIDETKLARGAVTEAALALGAVNSTALADGAVLAAKLAANSVTLGKLSNGAVTLSALGGALADSTSQRLVDAMGEAAAWQSTAQGTGATWTHLSGVTDAPTGQTVGEAHGFIRLRGTTLVPYEPGVLYRISARVRATAQLSTGPDAFYVGVLGVGADKTTLVNRTGANSPNSHYYVAASARSLPTTDGWITVVGYLKDRSATGSAGPNNDPRAPGVVHDAVRYISPYLWLNSNSQSVDGSTSVMQVDAVAIEALKTGIVDATNLVSGSVTAAALAADSVIAGKIAADAVTGREIAANSVTASEIAAASISTDKLVVAGGTNVLSDPSFEGAYTAAIAKNEWSVVSGGNGSAKALRVDASATTATTRSLTLTSLPILSSEQVYLAIDANASSDWVGGALKFYARWLDGNGGTLGWGVAQIDTPTRGSWQRLAATVTAPANTTTATVWVESYQGTAGSVLWDNAVVRPLLTGVQIADGAITAPKLLAGSVTAEKIAALSITAEKIAALAVTTDKLSALSVSADKIAVNAITATKIAAGAIEATHIKSGAITAEKLDADAINGKTINGAVITGSTLQTAASGQRVVISPGNATPETGSIEFYSGSADEAAPAELSTAIAYGSQGSVDYELPSVALTAPRVSGTSQQSGMWLQGHIPGYSGGVFHLYANDNGGNGAASITGYGADTSDAGSSIELSVRDALSGSASSSAELTSSGFNVSGMLKAGNIVAGRVTITPSAANVPTSITVTGLSVKGSTFRAVATPSTSAPGTSVTGVGVTNVSATGLTVWVTRTNTTSTGVDWMVIGS
ncbi:hypothetical protein [Streptomyces sp. NBC_00140]|uniref:hypothetical protein n=1 Tax=Streptomyces sp. NBC_00140 TaxID=2975664 RepID=UPI002259F56D|nr:hypothetical protein [Streptomyces sp. NBC_00140]MCX5328119.1 hypothetical protein [Streptomyces sp. NBC_00140]